MPALWSHSHLVACLPKRRPPPPGPATPAAVWETEEIDRTLVSWRQLAEYPLAG